MKKLFFALSLFSTSLMYADALEQPPDSDEDDVAIEERDYGEGDERRRRRGPRPGRTQSPIQNQNAASSA